MSVITCLHASLPISVDNSYVSDSFWLSADMCNMSAMNSNFILLSQVIDPALYNNKQPIGCDSQLGGMQIWRESMGVLPDSRVGLQVSPCSGCDLFQPG